MTWTVWCKCLLLLGLLVFNSIWDIKKHEICIWSLPAGAFIGIGFQIFRGIGDGWSPLSLLGLLPGMILMLGSILTRGRIGFGDGLMVVVLGIYFTFSETMLLLLISSFLVGVTALFLIIIWKKNRKYELPFIPFLALGSLVEMILGGIS